jgi:hypothetical protein
MSSLRMIVSSINSYTVSYCSDSQAVFPGMITHSLHVRDSLKTWQVKVKLSVCMPWRRCTGGVEIQLLSFLTLALDEGEWWPSHPGHFTLGTHCIGRLVGSRACMDILEMRKISCYCWVLNPRLPSWFTSLTTLSQLKTWQLLIYQEIPILLGNETFQHCVHQRLPVNSSVPNSSTDNLHSASPKINLYIVLPLMPRCHMRFSDQSFLCISCFCHVFKPTLEAVMAPYKKVHKDMQKKAEQLHITHFFTKSSLSTVLSA